MRNNNDDKTSIYLFKCAEYIVRSNQLQSWQLWKYSYEHNRSCGMFGSIERRKKMTEIKAAEMLKAYYVCQQMQVKGIYEKCNSNKCDDCDLCYKQGNNGERIESTKIAILALEKQIPKKPTYEGDGYADGHLVYDTWICPCCENRYEVDYDNYDHCPNCGQKLDWSDENETD